MTKVIDSTNLGYLISKMKAAFWPKSDTVTIGLDNVPTANSDNLVKSGGVYTALSDKYEKPATGIPAADIESGVIPDAVSANPTVPSGTTPTALTGLKIGSNYYDVEAGGGAVTDVTVGGTSVVDANGVAVVPAIPAVPTISTDISTDKASTTKTASPSAVYSEVHPAVQSSQPVGGMLPNVFYDLGTLAGDTTFSFDTTDLDTSVLNHWYWTFDTPSTAPTITWPAQITSWNGGSAPTIAASKHYEVSVIDGVGTYMEV